MKTPEFARHWAQKLGTTPDSLVQLRGGINNHVFRCGSPGRQWVIKGYQARQADQRDRMQAEVEFLRYAELVAPDYVPKLLAVDNESRCVLLEHIDGEPFPEGVVPPSEDVQTAVDFLKNLNEDLDAARKMIQLDAAEGFLTLRQHMINVRERLSCMGTEHLPLQCKAEAAELLGELQEQTDRVEIQLEANIDEGLVEDALNPDCRCVSPSDFGFHNAIRTSTKVIFIDFEFAGWDDPAKICTDFFLQQRVPVGIAVNNTSSKFLLSNEFISLSRIRSMYEILRVKWICIILGVLDQSRLNKIINLGNMGTHDSLTKIQLARCRKYIAMNLPFYPP